MGAEGGCTEANIMVYLGVVEQRANELLSAADRVLQQVCAYSPIAIVMTRHCIHVSHLPSTCHISPAHVTSPLHVSHLPSTCHISLPRVTSPLHASHLPSTCHISLPRVTGARRRRAHAAVSRARGRLGPWRAAGAENSPRIRRDHPPRCATAGCRAEMPP